MLQFSEIALFSGFFDFYDDLIYKKVKIKEACLNKKMLPNFMVICLQVSSSLRYFWKSITLIIIKKNIVEKLLISATLK